MEDDNRSLAERLMSDPESLRLFKASLLPTDVDLLPHLWPFWARKNQLAPPWTEEWEGWLIVTGRGWGKNRTAAEYINDGVRQGLFTRLGLVARTIKDVRKTMVEGESGILTLAPLDFRPHWEPAKRLLTWPNGAQADLYTADEPDELRGPSHDFLWGDEVATWRYREAWDNAMLGLRLGKARWMATTTPKATPLLRDLLKEVRDRGSLIRFTTGTTYENLDNLSENFKRRIVSRYEGTRLARQELLAQLLEDNPDALWSETLLEKQRVKKHPPLYRVVVAVDPMGSVEAENAETGIVTGGMGDDGIGYVLEDNSIHGKPEEWATAAVAAYHRHKADHIVAESNHGGDMVASTILAVDSTVPVELVRASRGKYVRAEPVSALYEKGRVCHVGYFPEMEDELRTWVPDPKLPSPNRLDALVWLWHDLMVDSKQERYGRDYGIA